MKMMKNELKKMLVIVKRFFKTSEKPTAAIIIKTEGDIIKVQCNSKHLTGYFELTRVDDIPFSITVNPYDFEKIITTKNPHFEAKFIGTNLVETEKGNKLRFTPFEGEINFDFAEMKSFENEETFLSTLKETESLFDETLYEGTQYLQVTSNVAIAVSPQRIHTYRYNEKFDLYVAFIHGDAIGVLTKSLKGEVKHSVCEESFVIQNQNAYFIINSKKRVVYPDLRKMVREKDAVYSFRVDSFLVSEAIKPYKKLKLIEIRFEDGEMVINPRSEEFEMVRIPIDFVTGNLQTTIYDFETIKSFFGSYQNYVTVQHQRFKNIIGEEGFMWWSHEPRKIVMVAGVSEPDYQSEWEKQKSIG